jgi:hypothetical protein
MDAGVFTVAFLAAIVLYLWWRSCSGKEGLENNSSRQEKISEQSVAIQAIYDKLMKANITKEAITEIETCVDSNDQHTESLNLLLQKEQAAKSAYPE